MREHAIFRVYPGLSDGVRSGRITLIRLECCRLLSRNRGSNGRGPSQSVARPPRSVRKAAAPERKGALREIRPPARERSTCGPANGPRGRVDSPADRHARFREPVAHGAIARPPRSIDECKGPGGPQRHVLPDTRLNRAAEGKSNGHTSRGADSSTEWTCRRRDWWSLYARRSVHGFVGAGACGGESPHTGGPRSGSHGAVRYLGDAVIYCPGD